MESELVTHNTFVLSRTYPKPPERVFAAFADAAKKRRWFAASESHEVEQFEMDFRVGGAERARYRFKDGTPFAGAALTNDGIYLDIVTNRRVVSAAAMAIGDKRISATLVTIELEHDGEGTKLTCTHYGAYFEGADGPQMREMGWRKLFDRLAADLVRP